MFLNRVEYRDFRNISDLNLSCARRLNIFVGENGQGKSNILEGLSLILRGQSFRSAKSADMIRHESSRASLNGQISKSGLDHSVNIKIASSTKQFALNEKKSSSVRLRQNFSCVLFSPDSLTAIKLGPDVRRALVDDLVCSVDAKKIEVQRNFSRILRSRNRVLKEALEGRHTRAETLKMLKSLDEIFIGISAAIAEARIQSLASIGSSMNGAMQRLFGDSVDISVEYVVSDKLANDWNRDSLVNAHRQRRVELLEAELASGSTLVGPHKHDIRFKFGGYDSRYYCSQGQQRALILAFKMAQILYHRQIHSDSMILLLDDVLSELDDPRQEGLLEFLYDLDSQIFLTTTDARLPDSLVSSGASVFRVSQGKLN